VQFLDWLRAALPTKSSGNSWDRTVVRGYTNQMHPVLVHTPSSIGMPHVAEFTCCSLVAFERPNDNKCTFTFTPPCT
jgi:hypothetical protein